MLQTDSTLDLRGVQCPMTYIKATVKLDELADGKSLDIFVDSAEAIRGIPVGLKEAGHDVLLVEPAASGYRIVVRKGRSSDAVIGPRTVRNHDTDDFANRY